MEAIEGMVLACTIHEAKQEAVIESLVTADGRLLTQALEKITSLNATQKRGVLRRIVAGLRPALDHDAVEQMPPRAKGWLAPYTTKEHGQRWLSTSPKSRARFRPRADLIDMLKRMGTASQTRDHERRSAMEAGWLA